MSYDRKAFSLLKAEQDVDDSKWETSKDGTVVKKQPGLYNLLDCGLYSFVGPWSVLLQFYWTVSHPGRL